MDKIKKENQVLALILCGLFVFCSMLIFSAPTNCAAEEEEELIQTHENPMSQEAQKKGTARKGTQKTKQLYINDGNGPGGKTPASTYQQTRPTTPAQTMRPSAPAQQMRPTAPIQSMRPSAPSQRIRPTAPN